jgi:protein arginine kinase activator
VICHRCGKKPAQVQYTQVVGGQKQSWWLCPDCAREEGLQVVGSEPMPTPPPSTWTGAPSPRIEQPRRCPSCGCDLDAIRRSGRVGCGECYETFRDHLDALLRRVHQATEHRPQAGGRDHRSRLRRMLETLRRELQDTIRREEFERAAALRDEIRRYEGELEALRDGRTPRGLDPSNEGEER